MISDLETNEHDERLRADVCIVGGGPAGISLALELIDKHIDVVLLESGGENYELPTQALYEGTSVGRDYYQLRYDRVRYFGGSSHHWGGWCVPLVPSDLEERDWVPHSGWPISWEELNQHYDRAQQICELDRLDFDPVAWLASRYPLLPLNNTLLENYLYKWSPDDQWRPPTHFGKVYREQLKSARNVHVVLHANAVDFDCVTDVSHINTVTARSLSGNTLEVDARAFVLAAGGLENPRLLLAANRQAPAGLGNDHDTVGRYFMEHVEGIVGEILIDDAKSAGWLASYEKRIVENERLSVSAAIRPSRQAQQEKQILNAGLVLRSKVDENSGYVSARRIAAAAAGDGESSYLRDLGNVLTDLDEVALWIHHRQRGSQYEFPRTKESAKIWVNGEQAPNPDSRVTLSEDVDELGMRRIELDWRLGSLEKRTLRESAKILGQEVARISDMRVKVREWLFTEHDELPETEILGGHHHMGTTRMSHSPKDGVVDSDCRVHGLDNLYVAGSSVFPTVGYANPTLTIVALAVRLAAKLDTTLSPKSS
jgi:choline dehydrogenase-like flavoprotein